MEQTRISKNAHFYRKLNWRQKFKRFMTGQDPSLDEEGGEGKGGELKPDEVGAQVQHPMTPAEMKSVEQAVEGERIDQSAFNVITDHIAILNYFESEGEMKKRKKEMKKMEKQMKKEVKQFTESNVFLLLSSS